MTHVYERARHDPKTDGENRRKCLARSRDDCRGRNSPLHTYLTLFCRDGSAAISHMAVKVRCCRHRSPSKADAARVALD